MRDKIVAGNWKMNNDLAQTEDLLSNIKKSYKKDQDVRVIVAPSFTNLHHAFESLRDSSIDVAAQNMNENSDGAYTGEVSASMLTSIGVKTVILGHSERRAIFKETDALLAKKVDAALENDMEVIFCCGEELNERKAEKHFDVVKSQLEKGIFHVSEGQWNKIVIAYEPVWAIGTGETASPEQAQEMHAFIRKTIAEKFGSELANNVAILYGGSVKPGNAQEIFAKEDVDGGLIGGASLKAEDFLAIVEAF
ncbi:triose-phosphate isomerase [Salinimicrobium sp. MT39]|uniref:Triosephosphate isomerase n=1 Tax=Salinimicrobium profundisediminis TaxID=2994553 RepID=A0A9X3CZ44_9FLAO|nr:triose-phosphate isomerase [Salinimicrobium profundisediminis]MCX2839657.1 triose-phosphate isomerase [Salinimicrobium profundisediminis]